MTGGIENDRSERQADATRVPIMPREVDAARILVQMRNPEAFTGRILLSEAAGKERACRIRPIQLQRGFGTLITHPGGLTERDGGNDSNRSRCGC